MNARAGKALPILLGLLAVIAIIGGVIYVPKMMTQKKIDGTSSRLAVSSALLRAVTRIEDASKKWPKSIEDLKQDKDILALGDGALDGITYDFVAVDSKGWATYKFVRDGKPKDITVVPKRLQVQEPIAAKPQ